MKSINRQRTAVFISHSSSDNAIAGEVRAWLEARGFPTPFLDYHPEDGIPAGRNWEHELYNQLKRCGAVVYVGSPKSAESRWCFAELAIARSLDKPIFGLRIVKDARQPLLNDTQWADLTTDKEEGYRRLFRGMKEFGIDPDELFQWSPRRSPFPGLSPFEEADAAVFFGREEEAETLLQRVNNSHLEGGERFITVIGASGSGKSSLVRAGLMPRLRRTGAPWLVAEPMVPGEEPLEMLARSIARTHRLQNRMVEWSDILNALETPGRGLVSVARDLLDGASREHKIVFVFVDQGEELVTRASDKARAAFIRVIKESLEGTDVIRVVATLRSEFLTAALLQTDLAEFVFEPFVLASLPRSRLASSIAGPAEIAGIELAPGLLERIVEDTGGGDALPLMAFTMERLYQRMARRKSQLLDEEDYEAVGGVSGALEQRANSILARLDRAGLEKKKVLETLLKLVGFEAGSVPTRRRVNVKDLDTDQRRIIKGFEDARLISSDASGSTTVVFVTHEALFRTWKPLREAIEADAEELRERSRLERDAREWKEAGRNEAYLIRGERLGRALQWHPAELPPQADIPAVYEFVEASRALRDRMLHREADLLANRIIKEHREDPERAMLVLLAAVEAYGKRPRLHLALSYAVFAPGVRLRLESENRLNAVAVSPDGCLVAAGSLDGRVFVRDETGRGVQWECEIGANLVPNESPGYKGEIRALAFGGGGAFLAASRRYNRTVFLLDPQTGRTVHALDMPDEVSGLDCSERLIVAASRRILRIWSVTAPHKLLSEVELPVTIRSLHVAPDEMRAAVVTEAGIFMLELGFELVYTQTSRKVEPRCVLGSIRETGAVAISGDGKLLALAERSVASVWRLPENLTRETELLASPIRRFEMEKVIHFVGWTPNGHLIIGDWAHGLRLWDVGTGADAGVMVLQDSTGTMAAMSPDTGKIATIKKGQILTVWNTLEHKPRLRVSIGNAFSHACFAGDDQYLITRTGEVPSAPIVVRDARTGMELNRVAAKNAIHNSITVSPDGQMVAINEDSRVVLRSIPTLKIWSRTRPSRPI